MHAGGSVAAFPASGGKRVKDFFDYKKPALWITATLAAASIIPAVLVLRSSKRSLKHLLGRVYRVMAVSYQAPFYSFTYTPEEAPLFQLTDSCELLVKSDRLQGEDGGGWTSLGLMEDLALDKVNFDDLFVTGGERHIARLRRGNYRAWRFDPPEGSVFYYLLQQRKSELYLAQLYRADASESPDSKASMIRCLFSLSPSDSE